MKISSSLVLAALAAAPLGSIAAQDLDVARTQSVSLTVEAQDLFTLTAAPLTISVAPGTPEVSTAAATYAYTTNEPTAAREIDVSLTSGTIPTGVTIVVNATAPSAGSPTVATDVALGTAAPIISNITTVDNATGTFSYTTDAAVTAAPTATPVALTVTYTLKAS